MMTGAGGIVMMLSMALVWIALVALLIAGVRWLWYQGTRVKRMGDDDRGDPGTAAPPSRPAR
jgi:hypothetical protein